MAKIFLISASNDLAESHLRDTLDFGRRYNDIQYLLGKTDKEVLKKVVEPIRIWGTERGKKDVNVPTWEKIEVGDFCLFNIHERYTRVGRVYHKLVNKDLAKKLWGTKNGETWELIYFIEDWKKIDVDKKEIYRYLGYKPNFILRGAICPVEEYQNNLISRFGSIESFIETLVTEDIDAIKSQREIDEEISESAKEELLKERKKIPPSEWKQYLKRKIKDLSEQSSTKLIISKNKSVERNPRLYETIKEYHDYACQVDKSHRFRTKNGGYYAEVHHIIPLSESFKEDENNILVLCPTCHKKFHYGSKEVVRHLIEKIPEPQKSTAKTYHRL
ncbi:MAG: HNH endonuclease [Thermoplasmatota archaeon]